MTMVCCCCWSSKAARRRRIAVPERKEPRAVTPIAPDCSSGTKMSPGRCYFQYKRALVGLNCRHKYWFALLRIGSALGKNQFLLHRQTYSRSSCSYCHSCSYGVSYSHSYSYSFSYRYSSLQFMLSSQVQFQLQLLEFQLQLKTKNSWGRSHLPPPRLR